MRNISILLSLLFVLSTCKKDEDTSVLVNASVANSSEGSIDFKSGDYSIGSSVTFTATPKTGYVFSSWTNTSTNQTYTTNPLSITVNENTNLIANFEKAAYNIMFTISGQGSVQKEVIGGGGFTHGSQVKLTATPSDDYSFFYWNNDPGDTENPKTITLDSDQNIPAKFDYEVAKDLVGTWEFEISDPASKNVTIIKMSIDISLNVLMTTIVNGDVISQIFTQMIAISTTAIVIGDFAVITNVVVASATSLSMNMIPIPEDTAPPTNESEIPDSGSQLNLSGDIQTASDMRKNTPSGGSMKGDHLETAYAESVNEETDPDFVKIIWEGNLDLPPNRPEGQEIKITYEYDENQIMKCSFLDVETNKETNVDLSMTKNDEEINSSDSIDKFLVE